MAQQFRSRTVTVPYLPEEVYGFLSDFRHFNEFIPAGEVEEWEAEADRCSFSVPGLGKVVLSLREQEPPRRLLFAGEAPMGISLTLEVGIAGEGEGSRVDLLLEASLPLLMRALAERPLKDFLEKMASHIETFDFREGRPK